MKSTLVCTMVFLIMVPAWASASDGPDVLIPLPPATGPSGADLAAVNDALSLATNARDEAAAAKAELTRAQTHFMRVTRMLWSELETDRDLVEAQQARAAASAAYDELSKPILASLAEQSDYRAAREALTRAQQKCSEVYSHAGAFAQERVAAGQEVLSAKAVVARLENGALGADPEIAKVKQRIAAATQHLKDRHAQLVQAMHQNPSYVAPKQAMDDATTRAAAADQQLVVANNNLSVVLRTFADQAATRDRLNYWTATHGLPQTQ
jgi:hypothetical protein